MVTHIDSATIALFTVAYDANGNILSDPSGKSYSWDFENRLTQAVVPGTNGGTTTFRYDLFGRRIQKSARWEPQITFMTARMPSRKQITAATYSHGTLSAERSINGSRCFVRARRVTTSRMESVPSLRSAAPQQLWRTHIPTIPSAI